MTKIYTALQTQDKKKIPGTIDNNGFLRIKTARIAKPGVLQYLGAELNPVLGFGADEVVNVLRTSEELFAEDTLASLHGVPVTADEHKWQLPDKIDSVGSVAGDARPDNEYTTTGLLITDRAAISKIQSRGIEEISPGFTWDLHKESGVYDGKPYQVIAKNIKYNHVSILPPGNGRGGGEVRIIDAKPEVNMSTITINTPHGEVSVAQDSKENVLNLVKKHDELIKKNSVLDKENEELKKKKKEAEDEAEKEKKEKEKMKGQADAATAELKRATSPEAIDSAARDLADTRDKITKILGKDKLPDDLKGLGVSDLKKKAVLKYAADNKISVDSEKVDDKYIDGMWDVLSGSIQATKTVTGSKIFNQDNNTVDRKANMVAGWGSDAKGGK
jgi:hypothetical protein